MTEFESYMVGFTALGVLLTSAGMLVGATRGASKAKEEVNLKIATEALTRDRAIKTEAHARDVAIRAIAADYDRKLDTQYQDFGETCSALRRFIEEVSSEMHKIEIWGRDHYVQEPLFQRTVDALTVSMREGFAGIKGDIKSLREELKEDIAQSHKDD
jgi:hypothetical protein